MKKLTTLVSTFSVFVTLGFPLESFWLILLRGNVKIVNKALVPPAVYKVLRVFTLHDGNPFYFLILIIIYW